MPAGKMCVREPEFRWREAKGRDSGEKESRLMENTQHKVSVGGLPSLQGKYHSHTHYGSKDSPWYQHASQNCDNLYPIRDLWLLITKP